MGNCESQSMLDHAHMPVLGKLGPVNELRIINSIWLRDYQGLYDYDSKQVRRSIITMKESCILFSEAEKKVQRSVTAAEKTQKVMKEAVFQVVKKSNYFKILPINIQNQQYTIQKLLWVVVRTIPTQKYPIREKDVIKFGKLRIRVREIIVHQSNSLGLMDFNNIKTTKKVYDNLKIRDGANQPTSAKDLPASDVISIATENEPTCRICLEGGETHNPLICPCKCTGSVKYIHLLCLRTWLGKQLNMTKTKHCISIKWTPLSCEMCKTHYKYRIYLDNKKYYTVEIPKPAKPYIVLEVLKKSAEYSKIYHFVSMSETSKLSIGRKKEIDIKLSEDISVSRHHANLIYDFQGRRFMLEDNKSKFGTLVLVKKNMLSNPFQRGLSFQMGGELFTFECIRGEGSIPDYYDEEGYINVNEKDEKGEEDESQEEDDDDYDGEEEEPNLPQNPTNHNLAMNRQASLSVDENQGRMHNNSGMSNGTNIVLAPLQEVQESQPEVVQVAIDIQPLHDPVPDPIQEVPLEPAQEASVEAPENAAEQNPQLESQPAEVENLDG